MTVRKIVRRGNAAVPADPPPADLIRRTRLMSKGGVMLVRVETFHDGVLHSTHLRLSTTVAFETFKDMDKALDAFRDMIRRPAGKVRLNKAA